MKDNFGPTETGTGIQECMTETPIFYEKARIRKQYDCLLHFCCDLDLDPMFLMYEFKHLVREMYLRSKNELSRSVT